MIRSFGLFVNLRTISETLCHSVSLPSAILSVLPFCQFTQIQFNLLPYIT